MLLDKKNLPSELHQRLIELSSKGSDGDCLVLAVDRFLWFHILVALIGAGGVAAVTAYTATYHYVYDSSEFTVSVFLAFVAAWLFLTSALGVWRLVRKSMKPALILSRTALIETGKPGSPVGFYRLADWDSPELKSIREKVSKALGGLGGTGTPQFSEALRQRRELAQGGVSQPEGWLRALESGDLPQVSGSGAFLRKTLVHAMALGAALGLGIGVTRWAWVQQVHGIEEQRWLSAEGAKGFSRRVATSRRYRNYLAWAYGLDPAIGPPSDLEEDQNRYPGLGDPWTRRVLESTPFYDHVAAARKRYDDFLYEEALDATRVVLGLQIQRGTAPALREYRAAFPQGRHSSESYDELHRLYLQAETNYRAHAREAGARPEAMQGILALLAHVRETDIETAAVAVHFLPVEGLEGAPIEEEARRMTGSQKVASIGPSFSAAQNAGRHNKIVGQLNSALERVLGSDILNLSLVSDGGEAKTGFVIQYRIEGSGANYSWEAESHLPLRERTIYPGIRIRFSASLQIDRSPSSGHQPLLFSVLPAPKFRVARQGRAPSSLDVYKRMAETAFSDFHDQVAQAYGIGAAREGS